MPISPSDIPFWVWLLCAVIAAGVFGIARPLSGGLGARSAWAFGITFFSFWVVVLTATIGITQMPHSWQPRVMVGLLIVAVWGVTEISGQLGKMHDRIARIESKLDEIRRLYLP